MTPSIRHNGRRAGVAVAAVVALVVLGIVLVPPVLTRLVVPERTPLSRLLGTAAPAELDFRVPEPVGLVRDTDDLQVLTSLLVTKEAVRTSLGRPANLPGDSPRFDFDYGYKGPTVRVLSNGSVEVVLAKSEFRHKSLAGSLWTKLADRDEDSGPYVSYLTAPDPEVLRVVGSIGVALAVVREDAVTSVQALKAINSVLNGLPGGSAGDGGASKTLLLKSVDRLADVDTSTRELLRVSVERGILRTESDFGSLGSQTTRGEAALWLSRLLEGRLHGKAVLLLSDVASAPVDQQGAINHLAADGIVLGYPDHTFRPSAAITAGQLDALINRSARRL